MFAIWSAQPNWIPRKPKFMFTSCGKRSRGRGTFFGSSFMISDASA
jgi:hypothetical protein